MYCNVVYACVSVTVSRGVNVVQNKKYQAKAYMYYNCVPMHLLWVWGKVLNRQPEKTMDGNDFKPEKAMNVNHFKPEKAKDENDFEPEKTMDGNDFESEEATDGNDFKPEKTTDGRDFELEKSTHGNNVEQEKVTPDGKNGIIEERPIKSPRKNCGIRKRQLNDTTNNLEIEERSI